MLVRIHAAPSVDEWPQRHLARFVVEVVEGLGLSELEKSYRGAGSASYHPAMLPGLLVYGYATRTGPIWASGSRTRRHAFAHGRLRVNTGS